MKIQRGVVKYKQRDDIECMYCITDDGRQYYFLDANDERRFKNGNRIVSTALVEAIDPMVKASHIGVIDSEGVEVVPCINKSIRQVDDDIIIVELAEPVSECVTNTISMRSDPLSATKLVSTTADVKDRLNSKMGPGGRFLFNDLFSEAGLYDTDGKPLVEGYYSFIGLADRKIYLSKNNVDSEIVEYSILPSELQSDSENELDVRDAFVPTETIENALNEYDGEVNEMVSEAEQEIPERVEESEDVSIPTVSEDQVEDSTLETPNTVQGFDLPAEGVLDNEVEVPPVEESSAFAEPVSEEAIEEPVESAIFNDINSLSTEEESSIMEPATNEFDTSPVDTENNNANFGYYDSDYEDDVFSSKFSPDKFDEYNEFDEDYVTNSVPVESYGMSEAADTLRAFIGQAQNDKMQLREYERRMRQYDKKLYDYEKQIQSFYDYKREVESKLDLQQQKIAALSGKVHRDETVIMRYEDIVRDQKEQLASKNEEIASMKAQIKESDEVLKLLPVLKEMVGDNTSGLEDRGYQKAA